MTDRNKMMIIFVKLRLCNEKCSSSTKTQLYYSFKPNLVENEALKNFNKSTYLKLQPLHHLLLFPCLSSAVHDERGHPHQWFFFQKTPLAWGELCSRSTSFFFICFLFFLNPKNLNDHLHQHSQTPNNLPIVCCLTNSLLTSWSLILLNLNSSKKITSINVLPHLHLNQSAPSKFNFFSIWPTNLTTKFLT